MLEERRGINIAGRVQFISLLRPSDGGRRTIRHHQSPDSPLKPLPCPTDYEPPSMGVRSQGEIAVAVRPPWCQAC